METHAVVWIGTNGKFCITSRANEESAAGYARGLNECGLPAVIITRQEVIDGDFKSNAQLEEDEDAGRS